MFKNFTSTIAGASLLIAGVGLLSRGLGFIREIVFAGYFGLSEEFDLYLVGAVIPITINTIAIYIGQNYFIPNYNKIKKENPEGEDEFFSFNFWIFLVAGLAVSIILFILAEPVITLYIQSENRAVITSAVTIFRIFLLTLPLTCAISILSAYYQHQLRFYFPSISQLFVNFSVIFLVVFFSRDLGIYVIPLGFAAGTLIQLIYLILKLDKKISFNFFKRADIKNILLFVRSSVAVIIMIELMGQLYVISDRYFFTEVEPGGIAALNYANSLFLLPITIFSFALSSAIFPKFSKAFQENDTEGLGRNFIDALRVNLLFFVPIALLLISSGDSIISLFYERGKFTSADTELTAAVLAIYAVSLVFYSSYAIINKLLIGMGGEKSILIVVFFSLLVKIFLSFLLVDDYGQNGLAAATAVSFIMMCTLNFIVSAAKLKIKKRTIIIEFIFFLLLGLFSYFVIEMLIPGSGNHLIAIFKIVIFMFIYYLALHILDLECLKVFKNNFTHLKTIISKK
jgi:putative peptidoglycan lipid II flippase